MPFRPSRPIRSSEITPKSRLDEPAPDHGCGSGGGAGSCRFAGMRGRNRKGEACDHALAETTRRT